MNRRLLLVVIVIIVIVAGAAAFLVLGGGLGGNTGGDSGTGVAQNSTPSSREPSPTPAPTNTEVPFTAVVIAVQDIPRGVEIQPDMVGVIRFPAESVPAGAFSNPEDVYGLIARTDIAREQHILARLLVTDFNSLARVGSDAAAVLEPGRVAVTLPINVFSSVAYGVQPGDRVDVIVSMFFVDLDPDFQTIQPNEFRLLEIGIPEVPEVCLLETPPATLTAADCIPRYSPVFGAESYAGEFDTRVVQDVSRSYPLNVLIMPNSADEDGQRPRLASQRTVTDAEVIWVGEFPDDGRIFSPAPTPTPIVTPDPNATPEAEADVPPTPTIPPRPQVITLAVRPQDAVTLTYFSESGISMTFALRSARTQGLPDTQPVTLDYILTTYNIAVPDRFNYGLQPAPYQGIRALQLEETLNLNP
jgi:pilus assembly protein CpaB